MEDSPRSAAHEAGYDEDDPYEGEDLSTYPDWWRENIEEFQNHGMRPYRPPRFADGELVPPVLFSLEAELDADIRLRAVNPEVGKNWELVVEEEHVADVGREREGEGFTEYAIEGAEFESLVRSAVE